MKLHFKSLIVTPILVFSFSSAFAFEYVENFEGFTKDANFSETYNNLVTNQNAVIFGSAQRKVVSMDDPLPGLTAPVPPMPVNPKVAAANPEAGRTGNAANAALLFSFTGDPNLQADGFQEQKFHINHDFLPDGTQGLTELWMQYDQYIPPNYYHRDPNPTRTGPRTEGRKVITLYDTPYPAGTPKYILGAQARRIYGDFVEGASYIDHSLYYKEGTATRYFHDKGIQQSDLLVDIRIELGHWQRRTFHIKLPSSFTSNDGIIEFWIQRLAETANPVIEKVINIPLDGPYFYPDREFIDRGSVVGYTNDGYTDDTTFLIDNFILSNDIKSIDSSAIESSTGRVNPPKSPNLVVN